MHRRVRTPRGPRCLSVREVQVQVVKEPLGTKGARKWWQNTAGLTLRLDTGEHAFLDLSVRYHEHASKSVDARTWLRDAAGEAEAIVLTISDNSARKQLVDDLQAAALRTMGSIAARAVGAEGYVVRQLAREWSWEARATWWWSA